MGLESYLHNRKSWERHSFPAAAFVCLVMWATFGLTIAFSIRTKRRVEEATGGLLTGRYGACNWVVLAGAVSEMVAL